VGVDVESVRLDYAKQAVSLLLESERPDVSKSLVLNHSVALDPVNRHSASIVHFSERAKGFVVSWSNHMHLVAVPDKTRS
jgi:hypothetical protein